MSIFTARQLREEEDTAYLDSAGHLAFGQWTIVNTYMRSNIEGLLCKQKLLTSHCNSALNIAH